MVAETLGVAFDSVVLKSSVVHIYSVWIAFALLCYYRNKSLLFIGYSLNNDRTVQVFPAVTADIGDLDRPEHFSIEQAPDTLDYLLERNSELLRLGITPIWLLKNEYDKVEAILRHAYTELEFRPSDNPLQHRSGGNTAWRKFREMGLSRFAKRKTLAALESWNMARFSEEPKKVGGADGTRTRDPRRDRPVF